MRTELGQSMKGGLLLYRMREEAALYIGLPQAVEVMRNFLVLSLSTRFSTC